MERLFRKLMNIFGGKKSATIAAIFLTLIGCLQMIGDLSGIASIKAVGAVTHASPAPKVFTAQNGFETFSSRFYFHWQDTAGHAHSMELGPESYKEIRGPYNRRNAYGAAISYGPVLVANTLTEPMFNSVSRYALCDQAPVLKELGISPQSINGEIQVELIPRVINEADEWQLKFSFQCGGEV